MVFKHTNDIKNLLFFLLSLLPFKLVVLFSKREGYTRNVDFHNEETTICHLKLTY